MTMGRLCGRMASFLNPRRGPRTRHRAKPEAPEVISTGSPPAKSRAPRLLRIQPSGPQTQWATGTYTRSAQRGTKTSQAPNFARSAIAPLIRAAVMIAKVSWKVANSRVGTVPCTLSGPRPAIPACSRVPMSPPPASGPNAREYPAASHTTVTSAIDTKLIISMLRTLFVRTMPP